VEASAVAGVLLAVLSAAPLSLLPHATMDNAMTDAVERAKNFFIFIRNPPTCFLLHLIAFTVL
jgi:ABC-type phosphate/phosphonate transport system permease subunit